MTQHQYYGHLGPVEDPQAFFQEHDYVICPDAVPEAAIDAMVEHYEAHIVPSDKKYARQSTQLEVHDRSPNGGIINGLLDPHSYVQGVNGEFSQKILDLLDQSEAQSCLSEISGRQEDFLLAQTMVFDQNTTRPHQDWIYLDSRPNGQMIAAWVALEDIHEDGIRFFVYPGSQNFKPKAQYTGERGTSAAYHEQFHQEVDELLATGVYDIYAPPLKKGSIFFWGSRLIHGSVEGTNPNRRRRSLASHFLPVGMRFGNLEQDIEIDVREHSPTLSYAFKAAHDDRFAAANAPAPKGVSGLLRKVKSKLKGVA